MSTLEAGAGEEVCDDEPEGEPQGQEDEDAAAASRNPVRDGAALPGSGSPIAGPVKTGSVSSER